MVQTRSGKEIDPAKVIKLKKTLAGRYRAQSKRVSTPIHVEKHAASVSSVKNTQATKATKASKVKTERVKTGRITRSSVRHNANTSQHKKLTLEITIEEETTVTVEKQESTETEAKNPPIWRKYRYPENYRGDVPKGEAQKMTWGKSPFKFFKAPSEEQTEAVLDILQEHYSGQAEDPLAADYNPDALNLHRFEAGHAVQDKTFDSIVLPILAASTTNQAEQATRHALLQHLKYTDMDGKKVVGKTPNYHLLIDMSEAELAKILRPGGLYERKARTIKLAIQIFHKINADRAGEDAEKIHHEALNAAGWTPGLLSLDFMLDMGKEEVFDFLTSIKGIKHKTASCVMCFTLGHPVFAVDTHVLRLATWLSWIPIRTTDYLAFIHLDPAIRDNSKQSCHQALWHHGQRCIRCRPDTNENTLGWKVAFCPLDHLMDRSRKSVERKAAAANKMKEAKSEKNSPKEKKPRAVIYLDPDEDAAPIEARGYNVVEFYREDAFGNESALSNRTKHLTRFYVPREDDELAVPTPKKKRKAIDTSSDTVGETKTKTRKTRKTEVVLEEEQVVQTLHVTPDES